MAAIFTLFNLIPLKDKLYGTLCIVILAVGVWVVHHERVVGADAVKAADARASAAQGKLAAEKDAHASDNATQAEKLYVDTTHEPIPDSPHLLVCDQPRPVAAAVRTAVSPAARVPEADSTVEHPRDVGPALDAIGRDADAQVIFLQSILQSCVAAGACKVIP